MYLKHICEAYMCCIWSTYVTILTQRNHIWATYKKGLCHVKEDTITRKRYGKRPCLVGWNCLQVLQHLRKLLRQSTGVQYVMNVSTVGDFDRCIRLYIHEAVSPDFSYVARPQPRLSASGFRILKPFPRTCVSVASSQMYCESRLSALATSSQCGGRLCGVKRSTANTTDVCLVSHAQQCTPRIGTTWRNTRRPSARGWNLPATSAPPPLIACKRCSQHVPNTRP